MNTINEQSILIEFFKNASHVKSFEDLITLYHLELGTPGATKLSDTIQLLNRKGFIKNRELGGPTQFVLTSEGEKESIRLFTLKDEKYPLNKYERAIINYTIDFLNVWNGQIDLNSNIQQYLHKEVGIYQSEKLKSIFFKTIKDYLYQNNFIEAWLNYRTDFKFKYGKGEQLHRIGTIEEYWEKEEKKYSITPIKETKVEYIFHAPIHNPHFNNQPVTHNEDKSRNIIATNSSVISESENTTIKDNHNSSKLKKKDFFDKLNSLSKFMKAIIGITLLLVSFLGYIMTQWACKNHTINPAKQPEIKAIKWLSWAD